MQVTKTRAIALALCVALLVCALSISTFANTATTRYQGQLQNLNSRMADLDAERQALESSIAGARDARAQETLRRDGLSQNIRITRDEIDALTEYIYYQERDIDYQIAQINAKQADIDANHALFLARTRAMFVRDDVSTLGLVLGADSFVSFLTRTDSMVRIAEHDRRVGENLLSMRLEMEDAQAALEARLGELEDARALLDERRRDLGTQLEAANLRIHDLDERERYFATNLEANRAMREQMQREIEEVIRRIEWSRNPYVGGEMAWPVPGFYRITSEFGWRFNNTDFHTGLDIAGTGIHGATVAAANAGTVAFTNWAHTPGRGYGIFVILDHGGGISTLYAHLSNISVSVGDVVMRGDPIGNVGSTGWSTGPHLHFEVREQSRAVNPRPWIIGGRR